MSDLKDEIVAIIVSYAKQRGLTTPPGSIDLETSLQDYGLESLDQVAIAARIEDELGVTLDDETVPLIKTLRDLVEMVKASKPA